MKKIVIGVIVLCLMVAGLVLLHRHLVSKAHDAQIAYLEEVAHQCLTDWISRHGDLSAARKNPKVGATAEEVAAMQAGDRKLAPAWRALTVAEAKTYDAFQRVKVARRAKIADECNDRELAANCQKYEAAYQVMEHIFQDTLNLPPDVSHNDPAYQSVNRRWESQTATLKTLYEAVVGPAAD